MLTLSLAVITTGALIGGARTRRSAEALREYIAIFNVSNNPNFII